MLVSQDQQLLAIGAYVLKAGFADSTWSDTTLYVNSIAEWHAQFDLHGIVLSRIPFFARRLPESRQLILELFIHDPAINQEALQICFGHMYGAALPEELSPTSARSLLAAASLLELDDLADWALEQAKASSFSPDDGGLLATTQFCSAAAATACSTAEGRELHQQGGALLLVHDQWTAMLQQQRPQQHQIQNDGAHAGSNGYDASFHAPTSSITSPGVSSSSSSNTFDPTAPAPPPQNHHIGNGNGNGPWAEPASSSSSSSSQQQQQQEHQQAQPNNSNSTQQYPLPYPPAYIDRVSSLQQALFAYLVSTLPTELNAFARNAPPPAAGARVRSGPDRLLHIYSQLSFEIFRDVMQSPQLPVPSVQERFAFAKRCIAVRNKASATHARQLSQSQSGPATSSIPTPPSSEAGGGHVEEQVVLAFGGNLGSAGGRSAGGMSFGGPGTAGSGVSAGSADAAGSVQIFRKPIRRRFAKASAALA